MDLVADIVNGLGAMGIVMIVGFIVVIALLSIIGKKAYS